jgi:hypothetical protein
MTAQKTHEEAVKEVSKVLDEIVECKIDFGQLPALQPQLFIKDAGKFMELLRRLMVKELVRDRLASEPHIAPKAHDFSVDSLEPPVWVEAHKNHTREC